MNTSPGHLRTGKALVIIIIIVAALGGLVVFLPAIASKWPGPGIVKSIVESQVEGEASVGSVTLRWAGPQTIDGLVIRDAQGGETAKLNLDLDTTLLRLATSRMKSYDITLSGSASGAIEDDGSISFAKLLKARSDDSSAKKDEPKPAGPPPLEGFVPVRVQLLNFGLELREPNRDPIKILIDNAKISAALGEAVDVHINGVAERGAKKGGISINLTIDKLLAPDGAITPVGATLAMKMQANDLPLPGVEQVDQIDEFSMAATSLDLSERVEININGALALDARALLGAVAEGGESSTAEASTLTAQITLHRPIDAQLKPNIGAGTISGTVQARQLPTDLLAAFMPTLPIDARRDIGPHVDVTAEFSEGDTRDVNINISSRRIAAQLAGRVNADTQELDIATLDVTAQVHPLLVAERANVNIDQPATVRITGGPMHVPGLEKSAATDVKARNLANVSGVLQIAIAGPLRISGANAQALGTIRDFTIALNSERLGIGAMLACTAGINGGYLNVDERISNLLTTSGELNTDFNTLTPVGTIALRDLPLGEFEFLMTALPTAAKEYTRGLLNVKIVTATDANDNLVATVGASTDDITIDASATRFVDRLRVENGSVRAVVQPELVKSLQKDSEQPIELLSALPVVVTLTQPVTLLRNAKKMYDLPKEPVFASVQTELAIALDHIPALIEPLELRDASINIIAPLQQTTGGMYQVIASALWHTRTTDRTVGEVMIEVSMPTKAAEAGTTSDARSNIKIAMEKLAVRRFERALGRDEDSLAKWLGGAGDLHLDITPDAAMENFRGSLEADFKQLNGTFGFDYAAKDGIFAITSGRATTTLTAAAVNSALKMTPMDAKAKGAAADVNTKRTWVTSDVPATLSINTLRIPLAMVNGEPFDPQLVAIDINAGLGAVVLADSTGTQATMNDLTATISASDLRKPLGVKVSGNVSPPNGAQPGAINLDAKLKKLLSEDNRFDTSAAVIDMTLNGKMLPLAIPDSLGSYDGLLLAALGTTAEADITADTFSRNSGNLVGKLTTPTGSMNVTLLGRDETLRIKKDKPMTAELALTPELRDRVLSKIHPIFADVRQTAQPIRATVTSAKLPLDGDVSQLDADLEITVGDLEFRSGSVLLTVMKLFQKGGKDSVPGRIEPIKAKVRNGVVTYDRFAVVIDKYTMNYLGTIDLNTKKVDLRTELPLEALALSFKELDGYADKIVVPLRTHGTFGDLKTEVAPDFNIAEEALKAGFKGALQKEGGGGLGDIGKVLDDLLNKNKKKEPEPKPKDPK